MTWVKLDDQFFNHRKISGLSKDAKLLFLCATAYSSASLLDGKLSVAQLRICCATVEADSTAVDDLIAAGLFQREGKDVIIHDYHEYNPAAATVLAERAAARERMKRVRSGDRSGEQSTERSPEHSPNVRPVVREMFGDPGPVPLPHPTPGPTPVPKNQSAPARALIAEADKNSVALFIDARKSRYPDDVPHLPPKCTAGLKRVMIELGGDKYRAALNAYFASGNRMAVENNHDALTFISIPIDRWKRNQNGNHASDPTIAAGTSKYQNIKRA